MQYFNNMTSSDVIAVCAVVIATLSLISTAWQAWLTRIHNKMSVRPHLEITGDFVRGKDISYLVSNDGLGPALICTVEFKVNDEKCDIENYEDFKSSLIQIGINIDSIAHKIRVMEPETAIGVGKSVQLMVFPSSGHDLLKKMELENQLKNLSVIIRYKCIYGREFKTILPGHSFE